MIFPGPRLPGLWCRNGECGRFLEWHWSIASGIQVADLDTFVSSLLWLFLNPAKNSSGWGRSRRCWRTTGSGSSSSGRRSRAAWWRNLKLGEEGESTQSRQSAKSDFLSSERPLPPLGSPCTSFSLGWRRCFLIKIKNPQKVNVCSNPASGGCRRPAHLHGAWDATVS